MVTAKALSQTLVMVKKKKNCTMVNINAIECFTFFFFKGMWAHTMNVEDYESLINRGWRRSGNTILILLIVGIELNVWLKYHFTPSF